MTLSGYLFAKLLDGKRILYPAFIWNRFLRLTPLLLVVLLFVGIQRILFGNTAILDYAKVLVLGFIKPAWPNGGWSITVEFHFYLILPILLFLTKQWKYALLGVILVALITRIFLYQKLGQIQMFSYWTIVGRIDQFVLGILAFQFRQYIAGRHFLIIGAFLIFSLFYWYFDSQGGFYRTSSYPSPSPIWIYLPTVEGLFYSLSIAWYDNSFHHTRGKLSNFIAQIGTYSYSIYLTHFFIVFKLANAIDHYMIDLSNINMAILFSLLSFFIMVPIGYLSYRFIELPFLKFRTRYIVS